MRFLKEKSHRSSSDFAVFVHVFPATSGMTLFSKEEARADHGQGMAAGTNQRWSQPGPSEPHPQCYFNRNMMNWLLVWNMAFMTFPSYWECHHPNWRSHIFQRGRYTTNQWNMIRISGWVSMFFQTTPSSHKTKIHGSWFTFYACLAGSRYWIGIFWRSVWMDSWDAIWSECITSQPTGGFPIPFNMFKTFLRFWGSGSLDRSTWHIDPQSLQGALQVSQLVKLA